MSDTLTDPLLGRLIDGRYEVRERVAAGGMATVYVAFDRRLEREVALKVMHAALADEDGTGEFVSRFRREAKAAARLTHPGLVRVYDQGTDGDISYLTMEYVEGENLRQRIVAEATLPVGEAMHIGDAVLDALSAAHRQGLVHRDVKPENVLLDEDDRPRLADFGLARAVTEVAPNHTGTIMGTVAYLAPELVSRGDADARTDVYAVGILLYEMVTGRQPFTGATPIEVASRHVHEDVPVPSAYVPWLPPEFDELVETLTARDPDERPADATAALALVRHTRSMMDDPTLDRRADPPSGALAIVVADEDEGATTVLDHTPAGATIALPIGLGVPMPPPSPFDRVSFDDDPDAQDPVERQRKWGWWVAAIVALLALAGAGAWWYNSVGPGAYTTVPPVEGELAEDATATLETAGFVVEPQTAFDDEVLEGYVISTDPAAQSRIMDGETIIITVSEGPRMETVPATVGEQEDAAVESLTELGFTVGDTQTVYSDSVPKGEVTKSEPAADEVVRHDSTVVLTVSNGPEPIEIPDVLGRSESDAVALLEEEYALDVSVERERTMDAPKGEVFKQDPAGGSEGVRTQQITLTVSDGPPLVEVPDYTYINVDVAKEDAKGLGLVVELNDQFFLIGNDVKGQDPGGGSVVEEGSTITLYH